jgi:septal ring factor EnvC (AmiA/AmiB activator)
MNIREALTIRLRELGIRLEDFEDKPETAQTNTHIAVLEAEIRKLEKQRSDSWKRSQVESEARHKLNADLYELEDQRKQLKKTIRKEHRPLFNQHLEDSENDTPSEDERSPRRHW